MSERIRRYYRFYGIVQGVGFRFQAMRAAEALGLSGYVHNEDDGSVSMEVQGEREAIDKALELIRNGRFIHIEKEEMKKIDIQPDENGFNADYW